MLRKGLITGFVAAMLSVSAFAADVVVRVRPPAPIIETRPVSPGAGYVWTPGYHRWDGRAYVWAPGAWVRPPRPHARWVGHHWVKRRGGWVMVEGRWR
ncbi:MAG TPA: YXWGXW repeat-containing protein [Bryobacteraceae bacterium]|jgi:hypothetical protein|nr:YXWGXW repeat-containing protein [Bryobacteraceae bacterium]